MTSNLVPFFPVEIVHNIIRQIPLKSAGTFLLTSHDICERFLKLHEKNIIDECLVVSMPLTLQCPYGNMYGRCSIKVSNPYIQYVRKLLLHCIKTISLNYVRDKLCVLLQQVVDENCVTVDIFHINLQFDGDMCLESTGGNLNSIFQSIDMQKLDKFRANKTWLVVEDRNPKDMKRFFLHEKSKRKHRLVLPLLLHLLEN